MKFFYAPGRRRIFAGVAILFLLAKATAQTSPERYLLVFETSPAMKRCLPAVGKNLDLIFVQGLAGRLQNGDEIGVWTVGDKLHTGQFPLTEWSGADAANFSAQLKAFLEHQTFSQPGNLGALTAALDHVMENSERLTVFIFCDGQSGVAGTPFDFAVRQIFRQAVAGQKKAREPFILVLRAQRGKFVAADVTLSPNQLSVPEFPPLPAPPPAVPVAVAPTNVIAPPAIVPSLIIVGTNVGTDATVMAAFEETNAQKNSATPAPTNVTPVAKTNPPAVAENLSATNADTNVVTPTNLAGKFSSNISPNAPDKKNFAGVIIFLAVVLTLALAVSLALRARRPRGSLITGSMNEPPSRRK